MSVQEPYAEANLGKIRQLLKAILTFAKSERLKTAANALSALGLFMAEADLEMVFNFSQESDEVGQIRQIV